MDAVWSGSQETFVEVDLVVWGVGEVEIVLLYRKRGYIVREERLFVCFGEQVSASEVVGDGLVACFERACVFGRRVSAIRGRVVGSSFCVVLGLPAGEKENGFFIFNGFFDFHFFFFVSVAWQLLLMLHSCLFHLIHDIFIVIMIVDVDFDAVFVVGSGQHEFS